MELEELFNVNPNVVPLNAKWGDTKMYVRLNVLTGVPELITVEPFFSDAGQLIPHVVCIKIDEGEPIMMDRGAAEMLFTHLPTVASMGCNIRSFN